MGKSRGGKYKHKPRKGPGAADDDSEEEEYSPQKRGLGGQSATAGMLPPSDSEEEEEEEGVEKPKPKPAPIAAASKDKEESEEEESEEESSSDDEPVNDYLSAPRQPKKKEAADERTPEQIRKDLERLELIRKKREDDRLRRIKEEGWDRYAPMSDTNRPPGYVPADHPTHSKA